MQDKQSNSDMTELYQFLKKIDMLFPVPLSDKEPLDVLASKFERYGTLSFVREQNQIVAMCAGYTNDLERCLGYISLVAVLPEYSNKGHGREVVQMFMKKAKDAGMKAVHLYAASENNKALHMYEKLGFFDWHINDEPRPMDRHLIRRF